MIVVGLTADVTETTAEAPGRYHLKTAYAEAVERAGAAPLVLAYTAHLEAILDRIHALVVTGGAFDVPPELYGESPRAGLGALKAGRTRFEAAVLDGALARGLPVLGVCGGMQLLNVARGGTLWQDLPADVPDAAPHEQDRDPREPSHAIAVAPGSRVALALGGEASRVNSTHHQAVRALGTGLVASAWAPDGVVEAIEDPSAPFVVGVQWHPELLVDGDPAQQRLYDALVAAATQA